MGDPVGRKLGSLRSPLGGFASSWIRFTHILGSLARVFGFAEWEEQSGNWISKTRSVIAQDVPEWDPERDEVSQNVSEANP